MSESSNTINLKLALQGLATVEAGLRDLKTHLNEAGKATKEAFESSPIGALGSALSIAAMVEMTHKAIENADALGKLAERTGVATPELSGLSFAAKPNDA